jgi:uncharacterized membrane protein YdbT with pleckstrin-like domain
MLGKAFAQHFLREEENMTKEKLLLEVRPSYWNYIWHWIFCWLILPVIAALWNRAALVLRVYEDRVVLEKGVLSKEIKEIFISDIRTIDMRQGLFQRMFGIGDILIATAGTSGYEDIAYGLPDPRNIKDLMIRQRQAGDNKTD